MVKKTKAVNKLPNGDFWVFGYGSLMWNPGFAYVERVPARIYGFHRCLCMTSTMYRGTPESPGLVLGLDRGGSTVGIAFKVAKKNVNHVLEYLEEREQITKAYCPHFAKTKLDDGRSVNAYTFVARHEHEQYIGPMSKQKCADMVSKGVGDRGSALEYLANTVNHLDQLGIKNTELHRILDLAKNL